MKTAILAIAETSANGIHPVSLEVVAFAEILAEFSGLPVTACFIGHAADSKIDDFAVRTGCDITAISIPGSAEYNSETCIAVLCGQLDLANFRYICIPHTSRGIDFAPVLAAKIGASCITGVEKAEEDDQGITFTRRVLNGKQVARVSAGRLPAVITVQPGIFKPDATSSRTATGKCRIENSAYSPRRIRSLGTKPARSDAGSLQAADVIVAAGNGIGNADNLGLVKQLAGHFPKSAVAGSRPVCDRQWLPYSCQIGVTGAVVRPKLYIACGISGASQHIAGVRESGFIVAINKDPKAAFFNFADICVVEDLTAFIPLLLERMAEAS